MLFGKALHLPSELAGDGGSSGMVTSNRGQWLGTAGWTLWDIGWVSCM